MKNLIVALTLIPVVGMSQRPTSVEKFDTKYLNWYNKDVKQDKINGASVEKAYAAIPKGKKPTKTIVVAVIDGGVDPLHEDLKDNMWVNKGEIPNNGIDDDNNGYIDDIYGWNFLGNAKGDNIDADNLELTRMYRDLREIYKDIDAKNVTNTKEYTLYKELDSIYWKNRNKYKAEFLGASQTKTMFEFIYKTLEEKSGKKIETIEDVKAIDAEGDKQIEDFKNVLIEASKEGFTRNDLNAYYKQAKSFYKSYYNINFNPRKDIIGDNVADIKDSKYGNPDVKGPDAFHGSFCAGIIGAVRNNGLGVDGIAPNVKIMGLRAVPNGDEYDKDIALAIRYAVDNGANLINMSFGKGYSPQKQLVDDAVEYANSKGVLLIHAAGNDSKDIDVADNYPDAVLNNGKIAENMITVGASSIYKNKKMLGVFSNYGKERVDIFAPGVDIVSLAPDNTYDQGDGTSFAAPVVTGVAALVWSYYPELTHLEVKDLLLDNVANFKRKCVKIPNRAGKGKRKRMKNLCVTGGVVNAYNAMQAIEKGK